MGRKTCIVSADVLRWEAGGMIKEKKADGGQGEGPPAIRVSGLPAAIIIPSFPTMMSLVFIRRSQQSVFWLTNPRALARQCTVTSYSAAMPSDFEKILINTRWVWRKSSGTVDPLFINL